jgi:NAD(P)-dependent dehydrogenase (short-subunit alcohol dehydrogenase family)
MSSANTKFDRYAAMHEEPQGPGDSRPTASDIVKDEQRVNNLQGKTVVVTGCSSGIGVETARALLQTGANLILTVRDKQAGQTVVDDLKRTLAHQQSVNLVSMELDSLTSVRSAAEDILQHTEQINVLILNAGIGGVSQGTTKDGYESHFGVNHLGHYLLFQLLKSALLKASTPSFNSRVVVLSSLIHRFAPLNKPDYNFRTMPYDSAAAYASSKCANIHFANHISRLYGSQGLHALSLHPGGIMSGLQRYHSPEYLAMMQSYMTGQAGEKMMQSFKNVEQGAATTVLAAIGREFEGMDGVYLEDCAVAEVLKDEEVTRALLGKKGVAGWVFDEETERALWRDSAEMVGWELDREEQ